MSITFGGKFDLLFADGDFPAPLQLPLPAVHQGKPSARVRPGPLALMLGGPGQYKPAGQRSLTGPGHKAQRNASGVFSDLR